MRGKIATIITQLEFGGAQIHALQICRALAKEGYKNLLISGVRDYLDSEADNLPSTVHINVKQMIRPINPLKDAIALYRIFKILKKEKPIAVFTHSSKAGIIGRWAAWLAGIPVRVHTIHGFGITPLQSPLKRKLLLTAERITSMITTYFLPVGKETLKKGQKWKIINKKNYRIVYSGIALERFSNVKVKKEEKLREIGADPELPVVGTVACFKPQKAPLDFVKMAAEVLNRIQAQFIMVGEGVLKKKAEEFAYRLGIKEKMVFTGWREDVEEIMSTFDVFVLTSLWEGLPRVIPEAMAAGKPVVASAIDGNKEAILDGITGFLVPPSSPELFAEKVVYLLNNPEIRKKMGEEGRKRAKIFSVEEMEKAYINLFRELIPSNA